MSRVHHLLPLILSHRRRLAVGVASTMAAGAAQLTFPGLVGPLVDDVFSATPAEWTGRGMAVLGVLILQTLTTIARSHAFFGVGSLVVADLRKRLFASLIGKEIAFFDSRQVGDLTSRLAADVELLQQVLSYSAGYLAQALITGTGSLVMIILISGRMSLLALPVLPVIVLGGRWIGGRMRELSKLRQQEVARGAELAQEVFSSIRLVHAFGQEALEIEKHDRAIDSSLKASTRINSLFSGFEGLNSLINALALLLVVGAGRQMIAGGDLTTGDLASFTLYATMLVGAATTVSSVWGQWMRSLGSLDRIFEVLDAPAPPAGKRLSAASPGGIEFRSVGFAYPSRPERVILDDFNLVIRAGEKVALTGPSGAGKSTIVNLLLGFYPPLRGEIVMDGERLTLESRASLRGRIALVEQEPTLFSGTIRENILYGRPGAADGGEALEWAAATANAKDFIESFPDGYETRVGHRGIQLSGGQKQRIAIARALLRDPAILLLDEATSALDAENEELVQTALHRLMVDRTTLIIAHRPSTIAAADRVIVLQDGKILRERVTRSAEPVPARATPR